jgi:hypothetical protein
MKAKNISGGPVNFPLLNRDVEADEVVEVPDDTTLPADYFEKVEKVEKAADKPAAKAKDKE